MAWTSPRTWVAGETVTAALLNTHLRDNEKAIGDPWISYTPVLTASTTNPTIGTGATQVGGYVAAGKLIVVRLQIIFGSSMNQGSGIYRISLPVAARDLATPTLAGAAYLFDASGTAECIPSPHMATTTTIDMHYPATWPSGAFTYVGAGNPWAWATSDQINMSFVYEAA